jgi:hypothetical protein
VLESEVGLAEGEDLTDWDALRVEAGDDVSALDKVVCSAHPISENIKNKQPERKNLDFTCGTSLVVSC